VNSARTLTVPSVAKYAVLLCALEDSGPKAKLFVPSKQSIVVVMTVLFKDHDLGIVIAPAFMTAAVPPTMKAAIMIAIFRDDNC